MITRYTLHKSTICVEYLSLVVHCTIKISGQQDNGVQRISATGFSNGIINKKHLPFCAVNKFFYFRSNINLKFY